MSKVVVVGGGIIGLFTAYYMSEEGFEVTILDKGDLKESCSTGNAGMIVPSHIVPLASPGIIGKGLKWMMNATSPFYIHPKFEWKLLQWCLLFYKSATKKHVDYSIPFLKNIGLLSKNLYLNFSAQHATEDLGLQEKGLLMLYKTEKAAEEEKAFGKLARENGLKCEVLSHKDVQAMEPNQEVDVLGGIFFPDDAHLDPGKLSNFLIRHLEQKGVKIFRDTEVLDFTFSGQLVKSVITDKGEFTTDYLTICAGSWSADLAKKLKVKMPLLAGKGYSFMSNNVPPIQRAAILTEGKVTVSPFGDRIRFGGTMEISSPNKKINVNRVKGIHDAIARYYPQFKCPYPEESRVWSGLRPCSPDGLPYIGFTEAWENVLFGTGHSMMGISLAPATGKILTEQILNRKINPLTDAFSPDRYS